MNLQQFLSEQSLDTLLHQFFSIEGTSQKSRQQESTLINSIVLCLASSNKYTFSQLYQECQYQLQVNNQQREAVKTMCRLMVGVMTKASYLLKNVEISYFVDEVLAFFLGKVFVTVCSADCIRCLWALVNGYMASNSTNLQKPLAESQGCCSTNASKGGCGGCNTSSSCCKSAVSSLELIPQSIANHEKICRSIVTKFLADFKLHVKTYPFKVRKDILKLIHYVLKFVQISQNTLIQKILGSTLQNQQIASKPLVVEIGITKHQLIELVIKSLCDQKDPRNMTLTFQSYLLLINLFPEEISTFNYRSQIFQNIQGYYPLSMEGGQDEFKIDPEDVFSETQLKELLDRCLLHELFRNQVREMLVEKMLAPPIHEYASLYVKFITKFNPSTYQYPKSANLEEEIQKYSILTMNLLNRLCEQEYLQENYDSQCHDGGCGDTGCGSGAKSLRSQGFSIAELISSILKNVFLFANPIRNFHIPQNQYQVYTRNCEQKFTEFLNTLIVHKLFNHDQNNKHAGTIIEIVKTILNPDSKTNSFESKSVEQKSQENSQNNQDSCCGSSSSEPKKQGGCCGGGGCGSSEGSCGTPASKHSHSTVVPTLVSPTKQPYGHKISYQEMLTTFIAHKFMQYWSAKGDVAFKLGIFLLQTLGLLILALNKKLETISIESFLNKSQSFNESTQNTLQHLLITLGNVYETHSKTDQIKIMVIKTLMILTSMFSKLYSGKEVQQKNINKIRKINNSIVHKDCIKLASLLKQDENDSKQPKIKEQNDFSRSQNHILKSYIDYLMELYVNFESESENIAKDSEQMLYNIFGSFSEPKNLEEISKIQLKVKCFDVKLYAAVRYLSIYASRQVPNFSKKPLKIEPLLLILSLLTSSHSEATNKLIGLLKYYTYPVLVSLLALIFRHISLLSVQRLSESMFINISLIGKVIAQKFEEWHVVEIQKGQNYGQVVIKDIQKCFETPLTNTESKNTNKVTKILLWYVFRKLWRRQSPDSLDVSFGEFEHQNLQSKEDQFLEKIYASTKERISVWLDLYSKSSNLKELILQQKSLQLHDLQCSLLYVKYLKIQKSQGLLRFNKSLAELYDPGMIEYFWNRLLQDMTYSDKSIISEEAKNELIQLIQHLPQKILVLHAEKITPVVIYETMREKSEMIEESKENLKPRDQFDYSKTELICKLAQNLPETSLISYVLPYCINFLKIAAVSCQKNVSIPFEIISSSESIQALLNINKIVHVLLQKAQEKASEKTLKHEKLKKSLAETHKKQFGTYFNRLIYHKKRIIRQSSRNLLMSFE